MPDQWVGDYLGVDLSPEFIDLARETFPGRKFIAGDAGKLILSEGLVRIDWAVMISFRPMVRRNLGDEAWARIEGAVRGVASKLMYLEYDERDEGSVE